MRRRQALGRIPAAELWVVRCDNDDDGDWLYRLVAKGQDQDNRRRRVFTMQKVDWITRMPLGLSVDFDESGRALVDDEYFVSSDYLNKRKWPPHDFENR